MNMNCSGESACLALALAGVVGAAAAEDDQVQAGRQVFERRCRTCHGGTATADIPIAPSLAGIVGSRAGTGASGVHSRPVMDSGIVWDRASLRRFLSNPQREIPDSLMAAFRVTDPAELETLLDYLETLHELPTPEPLRTVR
jgi:cytochrome c